MENCQLASPTFSVWSKILNPLISSTVPHYRIEGKILVKREEFDRWMSDSHVVKSADFLTAIKLSRPALSRY